VANNLKRPVIVVMGSLQMDLISVISKLPRPGETLRSEKFYTAPGGKGANQAVAAARLGAEVRMVGRIGNDLFGTSLLENCSDNGIDVSGVSVDPERPSGVSTILIDEQKENYITASYGANLACDDIELRAVRSALDGADSLLLQLEIPADVSLAAAHIANEEGVTVIWDPAPADEMPAEAYSAADVITPNQTEAKSLTGVEITDSDTGLEAAKKLVQRGAKLAIVKMAELGTCYASKNERAHVPPHIVEAVDTVAAGDAFAGAFSIAIAEGVSLDKAIRFGSAAGALAVTKHGAQDAMPNRDEIESLIKTYPNGNS